MDNTISLQKDKLFFLVEKFIKDHEISCGEAIYQSDFIIEDCYDLVESMCDIVGYYNED